MTKLAMNTTVEGDTYAAGTVPPPEVAAKITNPKAWGGEAPEVAEEVEVVEPRPLEEWTEDDVLAYVTEHELEWPEDADVDDLRVLIAEHRAASD